jgi:hypothetical protein
MNIQPTRSFTRLAVAIIIAGVVIGAGIFAASYYYGTATTAVTVKFEGDYPWLVQGATANYTSLSMGDPPLFVTSSGQLLMLAPFKPGTPVINDGFGEGVASLNWTVASRTGNSVLLNVLFHTSGCQDNETASKVANQTAAPCTSYNFSTSISVLVNVTSDEASVGGVYQGLLNFWGPPLLENASIQSGSVIINQQQFVSVANVSAPFESTSLILPGGTAPVDVSGTPYTSPIELYSLTPSTFGISSDYQIGWLHANGTMPGTIQANPFGPRGIYDFSNGLAYELSIPQYPINQTICTWPSVDCELANVSTTLGEFFRSAAGTFLLRSTNIPLSATQTPTNNQPQSSSSLFEIVAVAVPLLAIAGLAAFMIRRKSHKLSRRHGKRSGQAVARRGFWNLNSPA